MEEARTNQGQRAVIVGVVAILIGIAAVIVSQATKLTASELVTGGAYLKDGYRLALEYAGIGLIVLGGLLIVLGSVSSVDKDALHTLRRVTVMLTAFVAAGGVIIFLGYQHAKDQAAQNQATYSTENPITYPSQASATQPGQLPPCPPSDGGGPTGVGKCAGIPIGQPCC